MDTNINLLNRMARGKVARLARHRRGSIATMFALTLIPLIGCVGLGVDFCSWCLNETAIRRAADTAAMNAIKTAGAALTNGDADYIQEGVVSGQKWFASQIDSAGSASGIDPGNVSVKLDLGLSLSATVTYSGYVPSMFGQIFGVRQYPVTVTSVVAMPTSAYVDIQFLLDNSSSMLIGATESDILNIETATMCSAKGNADAHNNEVNYSGYMGAWGAYSIVDGSFPITLPSPPYPVSVLNSVPFPQTGGGPSCKGWPGATPNADGSYATAGAPCGFACHSDGSGHGNDPYGVVRASSTPITLRIDAVKTSVSNIITQIQQANNATLNNLRVGVWDFNTKITQDYPTTGVEAGNDFQQALDAVGGNTTGIQPAVTTSSTPDTDFDNAMTSLAQTLSTAGNGNTPQTPRKVFFLITDGMLSSPESGIASGPFDSAQCTLLKDKGYSVFVIYTPYYPLPHLAYFGTAAPLVQPVDNSAVSNALQACASSPNDYTTATDAASLTTALSKFLSIALTQPALFTR